MKINLFIFFRTDQKDRQQGSILVGLIIVIVIFASLGGVILSLTSTSIFNLVGSNSSDRAYYLAESGYRYVKSRYLDAGSENARDSELENLHARTFTLLDDSGEFQIRIYPFYFKITSDPSGTTTLNAKVPGGFPAGLILSMGKLKIGSKFYDYSAASQTGQNITFIMTSNMPYFSVDTDILPVAVSSSHVQIISEGGYLVFQAGTADPFPILNGIIEIDDHLYAYDRLDLANNTLIGIKDPDDFDMQDFTVQPNTNIVLHKFVKLHSTGIFGQGDLEARRKIVYHIPLSVKKGKKVVFHDTFEDKSHWEESAYGSHEIQEISGDRGLKATGASVLVSGDKGSLIAFKSSTTNVNFGKAHKFAGYFLSYDAQVKIGFDPLFVPDNFMAGLSFRLNSLETDADSYGISILRGDSPAVPADRIPDEFVPDNNVLMIVFWQQTDLGRNWIAYKQLEERSFFSDNMENGLSTWDLSEYNHKQWGLVSNLFHSATKSCTDSPQIRYSPNEDASLISPAINLTGATPAKLLFWHKYYFEDLLTNDMGRIYLSTNQGTSWSQIGATYVNRLIDWTPVEIDISGFAGHEDIKIRFRFTSDDLFEHEGWYIDDATVSGYFDFPVNEATLCVRVMEAASISFSSAAVTPIINGDKVIGQASGARGNVTGSPIVSSGSWAGGNAGGIIMLNTITSAFQSGETFFVCGSSASATVQGYRSRDNYIKVYYSDTGGYGTPDDTLLDYDKRSNPRGEANWPPEEVDEWSADNDYFTLVQWDAVNSAVASAELVTCLDEPDAIIRTNALVTPADGPFNSPETGLHTFGKSSSSVYFDDFALQTVVGLTSNTELSRSIQE